MSGAAQAVATVPAQRWRVWFGLATIYVVWGSTYLAIRVMVRTVPPLLGAGMRFTLAGAILLTVLGPRAVRALRELEPRDLAVVALIGTLLAAGGNGLVTIAEKHVPSGLAALLIASEPLWVVIFRAGFRERLSRGMLVGLAIGFVGVALLVAPGSRPSGASATGIVLCLVAAASWATGSFAASRNSRMPRDLFASTGLQMLAGGLVMLVVAAIAGEFGDVRPGAFSGESIGAFAFLLVAGSLWAFTTYAWLLQNAPISQVSTYAYVNPLVAVVLGAVILGETLTPTMVVAAAVIVASVWLIVRSDARPVEEPVP